MNSNNPADKDILEHNWYEVLSISQGVDNQVISKAIRKLSLKYHPDKNTTDPRAPEIFLLIQRAKDVLLDVEKRKTFDDHLRSIQKRKEYDSKRDKNMDDTRKKMKQDLENRMKEASKSASSTKSTSSSSGTKQHRENVDRFQRENEEFRDELNRNEESRRHADQRVPKHVVKEIHQIKVKWRKSQESHSDDSLYQMFKRFGDIDYIDVSAHSGIVTFSESKACYVAVNAFVGSPDFRVTMAESEYIPKGKPKIFSHQYSSNSLSSNTQASIPVISSVHSMLSDDIRRAVEREKYLRELEHGEATGESIPSNYAPSSSAKRKDPEFPIYDPHKVVTDDDITALEERVFGKFDEYAKISDKLLTKTARDEIISIREQENQYHNQPVN